MSEGATLQNYNSELVACIEEVSHGRLDQLRSLDWKLTAGARACVCVVCVLQLREKREELNKSIAQDEEEKGMRRIVPWPRGCVCGFSLALTRGRAIASSPQTQQRSRMTYAS